MKAIFSRVRHPSHPGRGHGSLTCHMTQFERSDWLRSENFTNIMIELLSNGHYLNQCWRIISEAIFPRAISQEMVKIQSNTIIPWCNITWYCIHHCSDWMNQSLNPQKTPIPRLLGRGIPIDVRSVQAIVVSPVEGGHETVPQNILLESDLNVLWENFGQNSPCYDITTLYLSLT